MKWILILIAVTAMTPALADVELQYARPGSSDTASRLWVHDGRVRLSGQDYSTILYEKAKHRFLILNARTHSYRVVDRQAVRDVRKDIARAKSLARALPESVRNAIESNAPAIGALLKHPLPTATLAATGASTHVGKRQCRTLTINVSGGIGYGLCVTPADGLHIASDDAQTLVAMATDLLEFAGQNLMLKKKAETLLLEQAGVPIKYLDFEHDKTLILTHVKHDKIANHTLTVPKGYEQRPLIDIFG
jgi:hypothetical protein